MIHIDKYEKWWIAISVAVLVVFFLTITISSVAWGFQLPYSSVQVDPNTVAKAGPFAEPGLRQLAPGKYEAVVRAQARPWVFTPQEMKVPVGSEVTFIVTSQDVQHGFLVENTNINAMLLPGRVTTLTHTFRTPGTYHYVCTEYCGLGHQYMFGTLIVE
ncbi:MAG: cytochrome c oxidase subunit II [Anaerolineae bacterium]